MAVDLDRLWENNDPSYAIYLESVIERAMKIKEVAESLA